ncbi:MAG: glycosyl hydrolase-related protein [Treponema sp.]|nr:glycosyl hydrolase-related protein [Treponema sp.]
MEAKKDKGYIIPHTHWDREWRYPIWKNRILLIEFIEELLSILDEDSKYRCFLLDGQVAPIEDYLEVKPQDKDRLLGFIREGRISVGPWYTLPDLYPLNGESLIRNLLWGIRLSESYGACLKVGYNSFGWGQTAQFPQIYKSFGFDFVICAKKVSEERAPQAEFIWEAPDGSRILTSRLGEFARANFFFNAYIDTRFGLRFLSDEFRYTPDKAGIAIHRSDIEGMDEDYFMLRSKQGHDWDLLKEGIERAWKATDDTTLSETRLFLNGCDFSTPQPDLTELIERANELFPDRQFINAPLDQYRDELLAKLDQEKLEVVKGELRDGPSSECSGNALASRIYLKQLNREAENLLLRSETLALMAANYGAEYPKGFLTLAWKHLLQSHPHDSINGVTQDKTADDVENRLQQALELGQVIYDKAAAEIIKRIDFSKYPKDGIQLIVFNPEYQDKNEIMELCIDTPIEWSAWDIEVINSKGEPVPIQHLSRKEMNFPVHDMQGRPWPAYATRHICLIQADNIPALGYKTYSVRPKSTFPRNHHYWLPMRKITGDEIGAGDNLLENEYLKVTVNPNGTFDLFDKKEKRQFTGLHYFEDTGDVGNYWAYYPPYDNQTHTTLSSAPRIWTAENGPLSATIAVEHCFGLPQGGDEPFFGTQGESRRSDAIKAIRILSKLTLRKNVHRLDIETTVDNTVENHRLRIAVPTGIATDFSHAGGHFTVDKRPSVSTKDKEGHYFNEMQTLPMSRFVDISDGKNGLALISNSITEFELRNDPLHTLYLTLFRAMGNMIVTGWECVGRFPKQKGSQLQRTMSFNYSLYPHTGDWNNGVCPESRHYAQPLLVYQTMGGAVAGVLPTEISFCNISEPALVVSCLKMAEDRSALLLRVYNPTHEEKHGKINFVFPIKAVWKTNLNEKRDKPVALQEPHGFSVSCPSNKILTFEIEWKE